MNSSVRPFLPPRKSREEKVQSLTPTEEPTEPVQQEEEKGGNAWWIILLSIGGVALVGAGAVLVSKKFKKEGDSEKEVIPAAVPEELQAEPDEVFEAETEMIAEETVIPEQNDDEAETVIILEDEQSEETAQ